MSIHAGFPHLITAKQTCPFDPGDKIDQGSLPCDPYRERQWAVSSCQMPLDSCLRRKEAEWTEGPNTRLLLLLSSSSLYLHGFQLGHQRNPVKTISRIELKKLEKRHTTLHLSLFSNDPYVLYNL